MFKNVQSGILLILISIVLHWLVSIINIMTWVNLFRKFSAQITYWDVIVILVVYYKLPGLIYNAC